jgi:hypothetical protein
MNDRHPDVQCIQNCLDCADACTRCAAHCLRMGGHHASPDHQAIMHDCADICALAARFMGRGSEHASHICRDCAEICLDCADSCERLSRGDRTMNWCADVCRRCASACLDMAEAEAR